MAEPAKPGAIMLQYANPKAANCLALGKATNVTAVGLCHGVRTTPDLISHYCGVPKDEIIYSCDGINHMKLEHNGRDLYPLLRGGSKDLNTTEMKGCAVSFFRNFWYFITEAPGI